MDRTNSLNHQETLKDDRVTSFRKSKWKTFDPSFAEMIKTKYPSIWALGGNIKGNDQFRKLYPITQRGGSANSDSEINALELREAWVARHYEDFRLPGVIAQIKWLAVGSRGEEYMKNLVKEKINKMNEVNHTTTLADLQNYLEHFGVKGMRWGVSKNSPLTQVTGREATVKDDKFLYKMVKTTEGGGFQRATQKHAREGAIRINDDPKYKSLFDGSPHNKELYDEYLNDHIENVKKSMHATLEDRMRSYKKSGGVTPSGNFKIGLTYKKDLNTWAVEVDTVDFGE